MRRMTFIGVLVVAIAAPALVIAGIGNTTAGDVNRQTYNWIPKETAPKNWQDVPGLGFVAAPDNTIVAHTVSAEMAKGKVRFRLRLDDDSGNVPPGQVLFAAPGANSFTWAVEDPCQVGAFPDLQWKRIGKGKAVAGKVSVHSVYDNNVCA